MFFAKNSKNAVFCLIKNLQNLQKWCKIKIIKTIKLLKKAIYMNFDFIKVGTISPEIKVADVEFNTQSIKKGIDDAVNLGVQILAFPQLSLTGCTCGDLFYLSSLLDKAKLGLKDIAEHTKGKNVVVFVGLPFQKDNLIYNACAVLNDGKVLGIVPKSSFQNDSNLFENRYFATPSEQVEYISLFEDEFNKTVAFGENIVFTCLNNCDLKISCKLCDNLFQALESSSTNDIKSSIIVNLSASPEFSGKPKEREDLVKFNSAKNLCGYLYANAGWGESTTDNAFSGHNLIGECGELLSQNTPFEKGITCAEIDLSYIKYEQSKAISLGAKNLSKNEVVCFSLKENGQQVTRKYDKTPFIKKGEEQFLIDVSAHGLMKRIEHVRAKKLVIGISGGLDSTLALIIASRAMQLLNRPQKDIVAITMPCFGTSQRTFDNSIILAKAFNTTLKKIDITKSVLKHFKDINHSKDLINATYENAQARERTQVLMDYANSCDGIVVGTGDLSELALGFATYNGDHMSMYAVNGSIPKTLVRHLVDYTANCGKGKFKAVLKSVLDTPISPELLPSSDDTIKQVTEDIVGPYILHDFFLYNIVKRGFSPKKTYLVAVNSFADEFDKQTILKWLKIFVKRFFMQQFKRSCMPDGVKVSQISLSPRGSWSMPSDAVSKIWLDELEEISF